MSDRYKIIISNRNVYKEIEVAPEMNYLTIGTALDSDVRLRKELFFGTVQLCFQQINETWNVICSDNVYFNLGDARKLMNLSLSHGKEAMVCYQESDNEALHLQFSIDFDYEKKNYDRQIFIDDRFEIKIGGTKDCAICIDNKYLGNDKIVLKKENNSWVLYDMGCRYGAYVNGEKINNSKIVNNLDFFSVVGFSFFLKNGCLYFSVDEKIKVNGMNAEILHQQDTVYEYPKFHRNTRVQYCVPAEEIEIQQPAAKPHLQKKSIILTLIPTIVMLAMTIVLRGMIGGGGTFVIYSAVSMSMGVIMSIVTYIQDKKNFKKETEEREETYRKYIDEKEKQIRSSRENELRIRNIMNESIGNSIAETMKFGRRLFEKNVEDQDFLHVYLGTGTVESVNQVSFTKQEFVDLSDPISELPEKVHDKYRYIENAPIISDFHTSCGIGIVGNKPGLKQMLKNVTLDLAIRHFYKDVKMVYLLSSDYIQEFIWVRWLKNVRNEQLDVRNIVCDDESKNVLLENLYAILSEREAVLLERKEHVFEEQYVVFVKDSSMIGTYPVSKYVKDCAKYGFTFVFLEEFEENMPQGCTEIIRLNYDTHGEAIRSVNGDEAARFSYPDISDTVAENVALKLGAVYVDEVSLQGQLTKNITMYELLGIMSVEDLDLRTRWSESQVYKTMAAPIGVKANQEIVALNISDKAGGHGPHGLVAGTTGSGKSEILQTYILSLASLFHPYDVGFVIIDFKGGGMANQFAELPHLIGTITNIDGREIDRSLLSIKSELVKRQEMFSGAGVNHINDYIRLYKAGKVTRPMPHLIMIVDEFAELKAEYPDFMKELISAARIGRTLGVHLILATQKPAGVVDAQIWSNSKFKLCLKVQTKEDSNEVLKTPMAAEIVEPGRAYFQVGNNEIFELIQSAYSGAGIPEGNDVKEKIYSVYERNFWGKKKLVYTNKKKKKASQSISQLEAIVEYVSLYCKANNIYKLPGICLPSLAPVINTEQLDYAGISAGYAVPVGYFDDPEQQRQAQVELDIAKENTYIVGSAQMGKTIMLQTIAYGLVRKFTPEQVNLYMVDCGSMVLKMFEESCHVGGVVLSNEDEKCKNLFKMLHTIIMERKQILSGKGVGNFAAYLEAGYNDLPMIVIMIDNMAAFKEYFPEQMDQINSLTRESLGVGISFIVTAATSNALNYRTQANFGKKYVLNCNDTAEYSNVLGHCKATPGENAGRGLFVLDKRILEMQIAIFGRSDKEAERSQEFKDYIKNENMKYTKRAVPIPMVPESLVLPEEMQKNPALFRNTGIIPVGMEFDTVEYSAVDLDQTGSMALMGDSDSRINFVKAFLTVLAKNIVFHNVEAYVIDNKQKSLSESSTYGFVKAYTNDMAEGLVYISDFYDELKEREEAEYLDEVSTVLLVINNAEVWKQLLSDKTMSREMSGAMKRSHDVKAFLLFAQVDNNPVGFNSSDVLKSLKEERQGILFAPVSENKLYEISGRVKADPVFDKTMGYRFEAGTYHKIKIFE